METQTHTHIISIIITVMCDPTKKKQKYRMLTFHYIILAIYLALSA